MLDKLANSFGSGWKGYVAGIGFILFAVCLGIDYGLQLAGGDLFPDRVSTVEDVVNTFLIGLGLFGIRHAIARK